MENIKQIKKRALNKITNNINHIYSSHLVQRKMKQKRRLFSISDGFFNEYKNETEKIRSIHVLIEFLKEKWLKKSFKDKREMKIINTHNARYNISEELNLLKDKISVAEARGDLFSIKIKSEQYLKDMMERFIESDFIFFRRIKINPQIWKSIIGAMLFNVPKETTIKLKESILIDYMPTINDHLQIQINELTTLGDILYIKTAIQIKQKKFENQHQNENIKRVSKKLK